MNAMQCLSDISDKYELDWDADSMLEIVCEYIDNQKDFDAFKDFLEERAADEIDDEIEIDE